MYVRFFKKKIIPIFDHLIINAFLPFIQLELNKVFGFCFSCTGHGNFGSVLKGEYTKGNGEKIPVAVKKLKSEEMNNPKVHVNSRLQQRYYISHLQVVWLSG